jgi:hypothetical protein
VLIAVLGGYGVLEDQLGLVPGTKSKIKDGSTGGGATPAGLVVRQPVQLKQ